MRFILVQENYEDASYAGASNLSCIHRRVKTITDFRRRGSFVWRRLHFFNRIMLQFTLLIGQRIVTRLRTFVFWTNHRVHRTSGNGCQETFTKMERSLRLCALRQALFTSWRYIPGSLTQTLVSSVSQRFC